MLRTDIVIVSRLHTSIHDLRHIFLESGAIPNLSAYSDIASAGSRRTHGRLWSLQRGQKNGLRVPNVLLMRASRILERRTRSSEYSIHSGRSQAALHCLSSSFKRSCSHSSTLVRPLLRHEWILPIPQPDIKLRTIGPSPPLSTI